MKGVFVTRIDPAYDDLPEVRYHFPLRYLSRAKACVGDWVLYYEPKRGGGRASYVATAGVCRIEADPKREDHFYAHIEDYLQFPNPVPYRIGDMAFESALILPSGEVNHGLFQWAIHHLPDHEYGMILRVGVDARLSDSPTCPVGIAEGDDVPATEAHDTVLELTARVQRDAAFSRLVRLAYADRCAFTGLCLRNGGGRCEIEAAHIRPVAKSGPDSIRNGLALSRTVHWMFDRGILGLDDDGRILRAEKLIPEPLKGLILPGNYALLPEGEHMKPHRLFLRYHRESIFKG